MKDDFFIKFSFISSGDVTLNWAKELANIYVSKGRLSYHLCVESFSQLLFDLEVYTKSAAVADFVYTSESNESCEKHSTQRW